MNIVLALARALALLSVQTSAQGGNTQYGVDALGQVTTGAYNTATGEQRHYTGVGHACTGLRFCLGTLSIQLGFGV